jgi:hypothetical protein
MVNTPGAREDINSAPFSTCTDLRSRFCAKTHKEKGLPLFFLSSSSRCSNVSPFDPFLFSRRPPLCPFSNHPPKAPTQPLFSALTKTYMLAKETPIGQTGKKGRRGQGERGRLEKETTTGFEFLLGLFFASSSPFSGTNGGSFSGRFVRGGSFLERCEGGAAGVLCTVRVFLVAFETPRSTAITTQTPYNFFWVIVRSFPLFLGRPRPSSLC